MIFLRYINHIKSYFFAELNEKKLYENYRSRRDLQLSSFEFFHLKSLRCSKKINNIFELKGIFVFSHLQFDSVRKWHGGPEKVEVAALKTAEFFQGHRGDYDLL